MKSPITAILYSEGRDVDAVMTRLARTLRACHVRLAGFVQFNLPRPGRRRCDMSLQELSSGEVIGISQDRGPEARGCHLDVGQLLRGMQLVRDALARKPDLLLINKFGKVEGEGGGFRPLIAEAIELGVPVLIAVPLRNIDQWRMFAGELSTELAIGDLTTNTPGSDPARRAARQNPQSIVMTSGSPEDDGLDAVASTVQHETMMDDELNRLGLMICASGQGLFLNEMDDAFLQL